MELHPKNPLTLRKLLAKRQNPCTQVFKCQPSTLSSESLIPTNLQQKASFSSPNVTSPQVLMNSQATIIVMTSNNTNTNNSSPTSQTLQEEQASSDDDVDAPQGYGRIQKKIKTTSLLPRENEEEREERESTSCESHSEDAIERHEIPDFFLSPAISLQSGNQPKLEEFKLDDVQSNYLSSTDEENPLVKEASEYALQNDGQFLTTGSCLTNSKLKFKCKYNHQFTVSSDIYKTKWCLRCEELLKDYQGFATKYGGRCTNQKFEEYISFTCHKGHSWKLNFKNAKKRWCLDCIKDEKAEMRKKCQEEMAQRQKELEEQQRRLFEEARREATQTFAKPQHNSINQGFFNPQSVIEYFQRMDFEIEKLANKYTHEFMSQQEFAGQLTYQQILQVYKILIMPQEVLQNYMHSLNPDMLKSEFRRFAKIIHPDKNKHPQAGTAFQKIYKVYETALGRIEGAKKI